MSVVLGYLDAGSGSLILQAVFGGLAGMAVAFKAWKARLVSKKAVSELVAKPQAPRPQTKNR